MEEKPKFKIIYSAEAKEFLDEQPEKVRDKIIYNITKSKYIIDPKLFKKLENSDIWEFRAVHRNIQYRVLAFWDTREARNTLVIATQGFIKKTQKVPHKEIKKAELIRKEYFKLNN